MGEKGEGGGWRRRLLVSEYQVLLLCLLWFLVVAPFTPGYLSPENVGNIFSNMLPLLVVASGQTIVLMTGGIDLSVTSVMALASVSGAMVMSGGGAPSTFSGIGMMLLVGGCVGLGNGLAVAWLRMPPFIVTLTTMMFFSGLGIWMTQSKTIYDLPSAFNTIGKGSLFFVPTALLVTAPAVLGLHILLDRSRLGRWWRAVGLNRATARVSGVPIERTVISAYVISGLAAAVAAILFTARLETGSPVLGQRLLLDVIGAAVIGGTSLFGGRGRIVWTLYGALFLTLIDNTLNLAGYSHFAIMMVKGGIILLAALLDVMRTKLR